MTSYFKYGYKMFILSRSRYWIQRSISVKFRLISKKVILLNIYQQKSVLKYNVNRNTEKKVQHSKLLINQTLLDLRLTSLILCLTVKIFLKQKILNKLLPNKENKRKKTKNWKDGITAKIKVGAIFLSTKTALPPIRLSKNNIAPTKHMVDFHIYLKNTILPLVEIKSR